MAEQTFASAMKSAPGYLKIRMFILIGVGFSALFASLMTVTWIWKLHQGPSVTEKVLETSHKLASHDSKEFEFAYEIKDMSMALINKKGTRTAYAQFSLMFDCPSEESKHVLEMNRAKLIDGIFEVGANFVLEDFQAPLAAKGFDRFKTGIRNRFVSQFGMSAPRLVVLKDWVMN